ncbi:hypothetical protein FOL46_000193 [Perkinsus olseni]|uniref:Uncharacterized protein n=1 Tax=Perkinsus olseni TaxID=32597 RepID=A0A7J6MJA9_PEROL|nr:hypothetical protein FOL46_000193 [Perkinsus olseni]
MLIARVLFPSNLCKNGFEGPDPDPLKHLDNSTLTEGLVAVESAAEKLNYQRRSKKQVIILKSTLERLGPPGEALVVELRDVCRLTSEAIEKEYDTFEGLCDEVYKGLAPTDLLTSRRLRLGGCLAMRASTMLAYTVVIYIIECAHDI